MIPTYNGKTNSMDSLNTIQGAAALLHTAFKEHQQGNLQAALNKYLQIINSNPKHPDALHLAGLIYLQTNQNDLAISHIKKSTKIAPKNTDAWNNLGISFFNGGKYKQAIEAYKNCIKLNKNHYQAYNNIGNAYREIKDYPNAIKYFNSAISIQPNYPDAENNLANALKETGKIKSAVKHYKKAIELNPNYIDAIKNIGLVLNELEDHEQAISYLNKCLSLNPKNKEVLYLASRSYFEIEDYDNAIDIINKAIELDAKNNEYYNTKGTILTRKELWDEAIESFNKALKINQTSETTHMNLGSTYKNTQRYLEAEIAYKNVLNINPNNHVALNDLSVTQRILGKHKDAIKSLNKSLKLLNNVSSKQLCPSRVHNNLGLVYLDLMELETASAEFDKALKIDNAYIEAIMSKAMIGLWNGDFQSWWNGYESRLNISKRGKEYNTLEELQTWDLYNTPNNTPIVILPEQGIGDEIMFASIIPDLIKAYNGDITLACDKRLVDIFQRSFKEITVSRLNGLKVTTNHQKIHLASIAKYFRQSENDFINRDQYLFPSVDKKQHFKEKYKDVNGLKIGISWKSGNTTEGKKRTIPLEQWANILNASNCTFFNLQYGDTQEELNNIKSKTGVTIINDKEVNPLEDMENFIALTSTLDLIISIDNSTVHISGALGVPTWVMLPYSPDWRWLKDRDNCLWYKSIKIYRQGKSRQWSTILNQVTTDLNSHLQQN